MRFGAVAFIAACACTCVHAQTQAEPQADRVIDWTVGVGPVHRRLAEYGSSGARLLTESGTLGRIDLSAQPRDWDGRLSLYGAITTGRLDYAGQTQSGIPLNTTTRHSEGELGARWRALDAATWGALYVGADWLRLKRAVVAAPGAGALSETSSMLMPAVGWRSPSFPFAGLQFQADASLRSSIDHRLRVHFHGVFDDTSINGGRRNETKLGLSTVFAPDWQLGLSWSHARQKASEHMNLLRGGVSAGTVQQPELRIDDVSLRLSRKF